MSVKPETTIRLNAVVATVWANRGTKGVMYNTTLRKQYKDDNGNWKDSDSFGISDLAGVVAVAMMATQWIIKRQAQDRERKESGRDDDRNAHNPREKQQRTRNDDEDYAGAY